MTHPDINYSYKVFIARRALRILPSLLLVIIVSIPFAWVYMTPNQLKDFGQSVAALSIFQSNMLTRSMFSWVRRPDGAGGKSGIRFPL